MTLVSTIRPVNPNDKPHRSHTTNRKNALRFVVRKQEVFSDLVTFECFRGPSLDCSADCTEGGDVDVAIADTALNDK